MLSWCAWLWIPCSTVAQCANFVLPFCHCFIGLYRIRINVYIIQSALNWTHGLQPKSPRIFILKDSKAIRYLFTVFDLLSLRSPILRSDWSDVCPRKHIHMNSCNPIEKTRTLCSSTTETLKAHPTSTKLFLTLSTFRCSNQKIELQTFQIFSRIGRLFIDLLFTDFWKH